MLTMVSTGGAPSRDPDESSAFQIPHAGLNLPDRSSVRNDGLECSPFDGPCETRRVAGAGRIRRATGCSARGSRPGAPVNERPAGHPDARQSNKGQGRLHVSYFAGLD